MTQKFNKVTSFKSTVLSNGARFDIVDGKINQKFRFSNFCAKSAFANRNYNQENSVVYSSIEIFFTTRKVGEIEGVSDMLRTRVSIAHAKECS